LNGETPGTLVSTPFNLPTGTFFLTFVLNGTGPLRPLAGDNMASARVTMTTGAVTLFDQTYTFPYNYTGWIQVPVTVGAGQGTGTTITFASSNPPHVSGALDPNAPATGLMLDAVSVTDAAIPEPGTMVGGLLALPLFWITRRRRKN
jgi:hypothetical protein